MPTNGKQAAGSTSRGRTDGKAPVKAPSPKTTPEADRARVPADSDDFLTTDQGQRVSDTDNSLKAGTRGPSIMPRSRGCAWSPCTPGSCRTR